MRTIALAFAIVAAICVQGEELYVDTGNTRVRVAESGPTGAPVLVLLHGIASSLETWDGWESALRDKYRIIRVDLPGSGMTPRPEPDAPHIDDDLAVVQAVLAARGITRYSVAGNSRGGWLAWLLARDATKVEKLILVSPIGISPSPAPPDRAPGVLRWIARHWQPKFATAHVIRDVYGSKFEPSAQVIQRYWEKGRLDHNRDAVDARTRSVNYVDHVRDLAAITVPTLILWGQEDRWLDAGDACRFHNAIKGSQLLVLPGLGHVAMEEDAATTAKLAAEFLQEGRVTPPKDARTDCYRMRPSRFFALAAKHAEADLTNDELKELFKKKKSFAKRDVFVVGDSGPSVILLHELPGVTRNTFKLADAISARGYIVYIPVLSGEPGKHHGGPLYTAGIALNPFLQSLRRDRRTRAADYVLRLADEIHKEWNKGREIGVIGMCITGNMPIVALRHDFVVAAVLAQPSLPLLSRRSLGLWSEDIEQAKKRDVPIFALRFSHDDISHWERQEELENKFKGKITFLTLNSSPWNPGGFSDHAHATLTFEHFDAHHRNDETQRAFDQVMAYLDTQLKKQGSTP